MPKCENCYHHDICNGRFDVEEYNCKCEDYKDKSLIVELPCKVGDIVYKVCDIESVHRQILELKVLTIEFGYKEVVYLKTTKQYLYNYDMVTFDDFGKIVFLTREEAEKALREREQNESERSFKNH